MKKAIGFLFLLLANLALLAHTVIPHHHPDAHHISICSLLAADDAHNSHCSHHDINGQEHGANGLGDGCLLNGLYIRVTSGHNSTPSDEDQASNDHTVTGYPFIYFVVNPATVLRDDGGRPFRHRPFLLSSYPQYVTCSVGLRAPPVC